ncbi:MAG: hypothetical protein JKY48_04855 [Flavobacteriales bacterium]|nr:hypothetical protein [Flavobacteriales bacterium]
MKRNDRIDACPATLRSYIDKGILKGIKIYNGTKPTYYVIIDDEKIEDLQKIMLRG